MNLLRISPNDRIVPLYLLYWLKSRFMRVVVQRDAKPAINQVSITTGRVKDLPVLLPNELEQQSIVAFLDHETARIDALIQKKEQMIELLKEKRIALIAQAVTKGLNPNVKRKDSGIEWLGEVPEHWSIQKIKYVSRVVSGSTPSSSEPEYWDGDILWVTPDDLGSLTNKYIGNTKRQISKDGYQSCGTTLAPSNSVVISTRAPIGHIALTTDSMCCNQGCRIMIPNKRINSDYLYYLFITSKLYLVSMGQGSTFSELSRDKLSSFEISVPEFVEQQSIISFLNLETEKVDELSAIISDSISLLQEYRSSLIHSAVTGKIDLRGYHEEH